MRLSGVAFPETEQREPEMGMTLAPNSCAGFETVIRDEIDPRGQVVRDAGNPEM